jgi:hypothetical protein
VHAPLGPPSPGPQNVPQMVVHNSFYSFHQPWVVDHRHTGMGYNQMYTDIVAIKVRSPRGKSLESLEGDPNERLATFAPDPNTTSTGMSNPNAPPSQQLFYYQSPPWRRSYDDGDITPTNETALMYETGGGTLPRPRGIIRPRPVAKIAGQKQPPREYSMTLSHHPMMEKHSQYAVYHQHQVYGSPSMNKKLPPNPPKRLDSCCGESETTTVEIHASPLPLPAYPSSDSLSISLDAQGDLPLPPPPAPGTPPSVQKMNSSRSWGAEESELINTLALQHRNGSDASFKVTIRNFFKTML